MKKMTLALGLALLFTLPCFAVDWITFENKEGGFKTLFPRQPVKSVQDIESENGNTKITFYLYDGSKYKDENEVLGVGYVDQIDSAKNSDLPDEMIDNLLHTALDGSAKDMSGQIVSEQAVFLKGYRGREGKIYAKDANYTMIMRVFLVQTRMYIVEAAYEMGKGNTDCTDKFFNSFDISDPQRVVHEKPENNNWATFKSNNFKILFPEKPEEDVTDVDTKVGKLKMHTLTYETGKYKDDNEAYILIYSDYPTEYVSSDLKDALIDSFFNGSIKGMLKKNGFKKRSETKVSFKGFPGRRLKIDLEEQSAVMNLRLYLVNNRLYILQTICYARKDNNALADKYFTSFDLIAGK
jgi:hypothetical protein